MLKKGISVIIATLGGKSVISTVNSINNGSIIPNEILICIPKEFIENAFINLQYDNVKIVETNEKGQVIQRIKGFNLAIYEYVLQIDDDVILSTIVNEITYYDEDCEIKNHKDAIIIALFISFFLLFSFCHQNTSGIS